MVEAQKRCVARQLEWNLPSTFSFLLSSLFSLLWVGRESSLERTSLFRLFPSAREDWLPLKTASIWPLQIAGTCQLVLFTSLTRESESQRHTGDFLVLWILTPPRPATHFWLVCSHCPGICSVGNLNWEPIAPQLLSIKMCNWISHVCFKHHSRHNLQATI